MTTIPRLKLSICGFAKTGKSTLAGRVAVELNAIDDRQLQQLEAAADARGRDFNKYSMIFNDGQMAARIRGSEKDLDSSRTVFPTRRSLTRVDGLELIMIDVPGHIDFLENTVYGTYLSDQALVVIDAGSGVREETEIACRILKSFDVKVAGFCVSKMDLVDFSATRFNEIANAIREKLVAPYAKAGVPIIPVAALSETGEGISQHRARWSPRFSWYDGQTLIEVLSAAEGSESAKASELPVRLVVEGRAEIFSAPGVGTVVVGTLEYGKIGRGSHLVIEPARRLGLAEEPVVVKSAWSENRAADAPAVARSIVSVALKGYDRDYARHDLKHGGVLGTADAPPTVAKSIRVEAFFFEAERVYVGKEYKIHPHGAWSMARITKILKRQSGDLEPRSLEQWAVAPAAVRVPIHTAQAGEYVVAELEFLRPICIEPVSRFARLGRFVVQERNRIIACGSCVEVVEEWPRQAAAATDQSKRATTRRASEIRRSSPSSPPQF